jgi:6-pyruvoyltetrahydropterin/6-carboxytetrahydropterin synthase
LIEIHQSTVIVHQSAFLRVLCASVVNLPGAIVSESYSVRVAKAEHVFSAAHFITFADHCERLHGHNYRVAAELAGPLDADSLVVDFLALRAMLVEITRQLDHYVLLPTQHQQIRIVESPDEVTATFENRRWIFPRGDCQLLPVTSTTAELLARHIGQSLLAALDTKLGFIPLRLRIELDECDGQLGIYEWRPS